MRDTPNNDCEGDYHVKNLQAIWFGATTRGNQMVDSGAKWTAVKQKGGQEGEGHDKELSPPPPPPPPPPPHILALFSPLFSRPHKIKQFIPVTDRF